MMKKLIEIINVAIDNKPAFGDDCNHCGYCCLAGPCVVGSEITGKKYGPCELLGTREEKYFCSLVDNSAMMGDIIGAGTGCCSETQKETMKRISQ